jgi:tRNA threonylcarbamoyladenosine modification (KEOPS) complex Cgi121 subunit
MALLAELIEFEEFPGHELRVAVFANVGKSLPPQIADRQGADLVLCKGDAIASEMHLRLAAYTALVRAKSHKARHKSIHTELMMLFSSSRGLTKGLQEVGFAEPGRPLVVAAWGMELERFSEVAGELLLFHCDS